MTNGRRANLELQSRPPAPGSLGAHYQAEKAALREQGRLVLLRSLRRCAHDERGVSGVDRTATNMPPAVSSLITSEQVTEGHAQAHVKLRRHGPETDVLCSNVAPGEQDVD